MVIGEVTDKPTGVVILRTGFGGERIVDILMVNSFPASAKLGTQ